MRAEVPVQAKICGINERAALDAALAGGAAFVGFVFYPPSPRALSPEAARPLCEAAAGRAIRTALLVDPDDALVAAVTGTAPVDLVQLHGRESPERVAEIRRRSGRPVMKAIAIETADDVEAARAYEAVADRLLFDAKPPKGMAGALPGGNALSFEWRLLAGRQWRLPWMLSGGLDAGNVGEAVRTTGALAVDVSSGVEARPGQKDPARIAAFLAAVAALP